jgi:hypothetical protein
MGATQEMAARPDLAQRVQRLGVRIRRDPGGEFVQGPQMIGVHDEFLEAGDQPAFEPAAGMEHEVHAAQQGRIQRVGRLIGGLGIGQLGAAQRAAGAERNAEAARQLPRPVKDLACLGRAEGRRARIHVDRCHEGAKDHRRAGPDELA